MTLPVYAIPDTVANACAELALDAWGLRDGFSRGDHIPAIKNVQPCKERVHFVWHHPEDHESFVELNLFTQKREIEVTQIRVGNPFRGLASQFVETLKTTAAETRIRKLRTFAVTGKTGMTAFTGGYFWAKQGFFPGGRKDQKELMASIGGRALNLANQLPASDQAQVQDLLRQRPSGETLQSLARMATPVMVEDTPYKFGRALLGPELGKLEYEGIYTVEGR